MSGMSFEKILIVLGVLFVVLGLAFIAASLIAKVTPQLSLERIPWILLWIYRRDGFWFATSPILLMISVAAFIIWLLTRLGILK
ncbi:hypothetical protein J7L00_07935 [Candidatus Bathyarchaeota archaeon]|nr:hypothetical protein [Candidatus Bathyarchaeota archaeon]